MPSEQTYEPSTVMMGPWPSADDTRSSDFLRSGHPVARETPSSASNSSAMSSNTLNSSKDNSTRPSSRKSGIFGIDQMSPPQNDSSGSSSNGDNDVGENLPVKVTSEKGFEEIELTSTRQASSSTPSEKRKASQGRYQRNPREWTAPNQASPKMTHRSRSNSRGSQRSLPTSQENLSTPVAPTMLQSTKKRLLRQASENVLVRNHRALIKNSDIASLSGQRRSASRDRLSLRTPHQPFNTSSTLRPDIVKLREKRYSQPARPSDMIIQNGQVYRLMSGNQPNKDQKLPPTPHPQGYGGEPPAIQYVPIIPADYQTMYYPILPFGGGTGAAYVMSPDVAETMSLKDVANGRKRIYNTTSSNYGEQDRDTTSLADGMSGSRGTSTYDPYDASDMISLHGLARLEDPEGFDDVSLCSAYNPMAYVDSFTTPHPDIPEHPEEDDLHSVPELRPHEQAAHNRRRHSSTPSLSEAQLKKLYGSSANQTSQQVAHDRGNMVLQLVFPHQESGHTAEARIQGEVDEDSGEWDEDAGNFQDFDKATQKRAPLHVATRSFSQNSLVQRQPQGSGGGSSGVVVSRGDSGIGGDAPTGSAGSGGFKSPLAQNDTLSLRSYGNTQPSASSEREKWDNFTDTLTIVLSCIYALFLLMLGSVIYIADSALPEVNIAEVFSTYLSLLGMVFLIYIHVDIRLYQKKIAQAKRSAVMKGFCQFWPTVAADVMHVEAGNSPTASENASTKPIQKAEQLDFNPAKAYSITNKGYWFLSGRHGGNIYLKIGTAGFCLGHMIHEGLLLGRQLIYFTTSDEEIYNECADTATLMLDIIHPLFIFYSLFIVFKYHSVVIERHRGLARFGLMHCIASSLCFWFWTILRETIDSIQHYYYKKYSGSGGSDYGTTTTGTEDSTYSDEDDSGDVMSLGLSPPTSGAYTGSSTGGSAKLDDPLGGFLNDTLLGTYTKVCIGGAQVTGLIAEVAPYLYPFSIEFNILVAGVWFLMYRNIGMKHESELEVESDQRNEYIPVGTSEKKHKDEHIVIIDCHSANRGLFAGMLCLVLTVVSVIIFFLAFSDEDYKDVGYYVNMASELTLSVLMIISSTVAYKQITKLDVVRHSHAELDTLLLFIAVPCFFLYAIFTTVPSIHYGSVTYIVAVFCQVIQVIIQTPMIIEGLKRCSNSQRLREKKPGKELISFLIIANIAMWIIETFEIKSAEAHKERTEYYGKIVWTLLSHMTLPLCLFYRFHSSVCLVDIWKNAYEPEE